MEIEPLRVVAFVHVLLFAYWLGADVGVFLCARQLTRDDLTLEERLRVRQIAMIIDLAPRFALVLMVPVGFTLSTLYGLPLGRGALTVIWVASLVWAYLVWMVHHKKNEPAGRTLQKLDFAVRYALMAFMIGFGLWCLATQAPIADLWLAAKIFLFGLIILNGIWLRLIGTRWQAAFDLVRAGGSDRLRGEAMIKANRRTASKAALLIWALVAIMAFLGVVKPF